MLHLGRYFSIYSHSDHQRKKTKDVKQMKKIIQLTDNFANLKVRRIKLFIE